MAIVIDSTTGEIDLDQTTPSTYVVTYTVQGVSSTQEVTINAFDDATFSYSANSYTPTDADPTPTITGLTGGTFSGTTGLVINSTTGEIDLSASTVAAHTVTYNTSSSGSSVCPNTSTFGLVITLNQIANNYSMSFDSASSEYIKLTTVTTSGDDLTIMFWFKNGNGSGSQYLLFGDNNNSIYHVSNTVFYAKINGYTKYIQTGANTVPAVLDGNWHHIAITKSGSTVTWFIDGNSYTGGGSGTTGGFFFNHIGATSTPNSYFDGNLDELAVWNTALTSTQIQSIYDATGTNLTKNLTTVSGSNLVYWNRMGD